ncbi:MAG: hypothetical protein R3C31_12410 [Hyphomonadaceae bacterium]
MNALTSELQGWWNEQVANPDDPFADPPTPTGTIFDVLPVLDSLAAVTGLIAIEKHVPFKVTSRVIRKGGYNSFEDMISDLMPKLEKLADKHAEKAGTTMKKDAA